MVSAFLLNKICCRRSVVISFFLRGIHFITCFQSEGDQACKTRTCTPEIPTVRDNLTIQGWNSPEKSNLCCIAALSAVFKHVLLKKWKSTWCITSLNHPISVSYVLSRLAQSLNCTSMYSTIISLKIKVTARYFYNILVSQIYFTGLNIWILFRWRIDHKVERGFGWDLPSSNVTIANSWLNTSKSSSVTKFGIRRNLSSNVNCALIQWAHPFIWLCT